MRPVFLIPLTIVCLFSCCLSFFIGRFSVSYTGRIGEDSARAALTEDLIYSLYLADQAYFVKHGSHISGLSDLSGIYFDITPTELILDGWDTPFKFEKDGRILWSAGPDGVWGTEDDIRRELPNLEEGTE